MANFIEELLEEARSAFIQGDYSAAEPMLLQTSLSKTPEAWQMLSTIYYDQGKFNKAINGFKKALELDPSYTDAAVGLSIILNDIGRYDEAKQVFEQAKNQLELQTEAQNKVAQKSSADINELFANKHGELADMYLHHKRFDESLQEYRKALLLSANKADAVSSLTVRISQCYLEKGDKNQAVKELKLVLQLQPKALAPRLKLGLIFYNNHHIAEAVDQWENVLRYDPKNAEAHRFLKMAQATGVTYINT